MFKDIELLQMRYLRGPNFWTYYPAVEVWVDIGELEQYPSNILPGFVGRLQAWLPGLIEHHCGVGVYGGFVQRLVDGTWPAHIMEHVAIELQSMAGLSVKFGKARETSQAGIYKVVIRSSEEQVTRASLWAARDLVMAAINDTPYDVNATVQNLRALHNQFALDSSVTTMVNAAVARKIPVIRLAERNAVQFGYGSCQQQVENSDVDINDLFPPGAAARIPLVGIVGAKQLILLTQCVAGLLHYSGLRTGLACQAGLFIEQKKISATDARQFDVAENLLMHPNVDAAVFETSALRILEEGLPYDRCLVGVVTALPEEPELIKHDIHTEEQLKNVIRTQVDLVLPEGVAVLNAEDPVVASLADLCDGSVIFYAISSSNTILDNHLQQGKRGVYCLENNIILAQGAEKTILCTFDFEPVARLIPALTISNLLAAVTTAWALALSPELICAGLEVFLDNKT